MICPKHRHLVLMSKASRLGRVKTRLAREVGYVVAWMFHRRTLFNIARKLQSPKWTCWLSVSPARSRNNTHQWPKFWTLIHQGSGDLGARILKPLCELPPGPMVIIGSDIPGIQASDIDAAFKALQKNDFVFGPCPDGGFWLIGAQRNGRIRDPFGGVRWSTEHALRDVLARLPKNARVAMINELSDVDYAKDL